MDIKLRRVRHNQVGIYDVISNGYKFILLTRIEREW